MKRIIFPALVSLVAAVSPAFAAESPFVWQVPEGWTLSVKEEMGFHTFSVGTGMGLMLLSKWPAATKPEDIAKTVKLMGEKFAKGAKAKDLFLKKDEPQLGEIKGELFQGNFALFELKEPDDMVQSSFMVHDGKGGVFNGQFTGKATDWEKALTLLKTAKAK